MIKQSFTNKAGDLRMRAHYAKSMREKHGEHTLVMFQLGDVWEAYDECAEIIEKLCGTHTTFSDGVTVTDWIEDYNYAIFARTVRAGYKIIVIEKEYT